MRLVPETTSSYHALIRATASLFGLLRRRLRRTVPLDRRQTAEDQKRTDENQAPQTTNLGPPLQSQTAAALVERGGAERNKIRSFRRNTPFVEIGRGVETAAKGGEKGQVTQGGNKRRQAWATDHTTMMGVEFSLFGRVFEFHWETLCPRICGKPCVSNSGSIVGNIFALATARLRGVIAIRVQQRHHQPTR